MSCDGPSLLHLLVLLLAAGCGEEPAPPLAAKLPPPAVVVAPVRTGDVPIRREFVARTEAVETVDIQARVQAILVAKAFDEGRPVRKDQVLYRLDDRTYRANLQSAQALLARAEANLKLAREQVRVRAAEAGLAQAHARLAKAEQDVARLRPLAEKDAVPRQDLDTALAAEEVAKAEVQAQEATLHNASIQEEVGILLAEAEVQGARAALDLAQQDLEFCTITSPLDGLIGRTRVSVGNLVGRGESAVLATASSVDPIYVTFAISEAEYLRLEAQARGKGSDLKQQAVQLVLADDSVYEREGFGVMTERAVSEQTGTLQVVTRFPNPDGRLRPGQFGRVRVLVTTLENALLVPQRAVMEQQGAKVVFVVGAGDVVALRTLQVLERTEDAWVVSSGVEPGEKVIVEGQLKARPGAPVVPMDAPISSEPKRGG